MEQYDADYIDEDIELRTDTRTLSYLSEANPDAYVLISCREGYLQFRFNGTPVQIGKQLSFICPPNNRMTQFLLSPDIKIAILKISTRLVQGLLGSYMEQWNRFFYVNQCNIQLATDKHLNQMKYYYDLIDSKTTSEAVPYHKEIMQSIIRAMLFEILSLLKMDAQAPQDVAEMSRSKYHFNQFLELLSATSVKHKPVEYYSEKLCISAKYLSSICKECSHKSARQWIDDMKDEDIRYHLLSTGLSIKEIASKLGFEDFSFFCKYVRRHFGCSPTEYRKKNGLENRDNTKAATVRNE